MFVWFFDDVWMMLGWFLDDSGMILGWLLDDVGMILGWFWDDFEMILVWFWNDFGMILGWFWDHFGTFCFSGGEDASLYFFAYIICIQSPIKKNKIAPAGNRVGGETPTRPSTDAALSLPSAERTNELLPSAGGSTRLLLRNQEVPWFRAA